MKKYALNILLAGLTLCVANVALAGSIVKALTIYNETGYVLHPRQNSNELHNLPAVLPVGPTDVQYGNLKKEEYILLRPITGPIDTNNMYFGLDNAGFHGYTATGFSYWWNTSDPTNIKVYVCDASSYKVCQTKAHSPEFVMA